jgi:hypothetical protein
MLGHLIFRTYGVTVATQVLVNGVGLGLMIVLAVALERRRRPVAGAVATARTSVAGATARTSVAVATARTSVAVATARTSNVQPAAALVENRLADRSAV